MVRSSSIIVSCKNRGAHHHQHVSCENGAPLHAYIGVCRVCHISVRPPRPRLPSQPATCVRSCQRPASAPRLTPRRPQSGCQSGSRRALRRARAAHLPRLAACCLISSNWRRTERTWLGLGFGLRLGLGLGPGFGLGLGSELGLDSGLASSLQCS